MGRSRAEQGRTDPHMGGAEAHGGLVIAAHAHGQHAQTVAIGDPLQQGEMHGRLLVQRRNTHQALQVEVIVRPDSRDEVVRIRRGHPGLLRLLAGVDLDQDARSLARTHPGVGYGAGQFGAVQGLDHVEQGKGVIGLVGLQWADQAQFQIRQGFSPFCPAAVRLLNPVLTEHPLAGVQRRLYRRVGLLLGNGGQRDIRSVPPCCAGRFCDAATHRVQG